MKAIRLEWMGIIAGALGVALWLQTAQAAPPCDQEKAKSATGACIANAFLCSSQNAANCAGCSCVTVASFPTGCIGNAPNKTNCNMPLAQCTQFVSCEWDDVAGACVVTPGSGGAISDAAKPTTVNCA